MIKPTDLTDFQILMLARQHQLIAKLDYIIEQSGFAPFEGHTQEVNGILHGYDIPHDMQVDKEQWLTEDKMKECKKILGIYWQLEHCASGQCLTSGQAVPQDFAERTAFRGFDRHGTAESSYNHFAKYLFDRGQFDNIKNITTSSTAMLHQYRAVVERLEKAGKLTSTGDLVASHFTTSADLQDLADLIDPPTA